MAKPILMFLMVYLIAFGIRRGPLGCWTFDPLPLEGDKVRQIRKTYHLMILRELYPSLPMKTTAKANLVISVVFWVGLGL